MKLLPLFILASTIILSIQSEIHHLGYQTRQEFSRMSASQRQYRSLISKNNMDLINQHNSQPGQTYKMKPHSWLLHLTNQEYRQKVLMQGTDLPKLMSVASDKQISLKVALLKAVNIISKDWQKKVTKVKDQGYCGSVYAFVVLSQIEFYYANFRSIVLDLSQQQVVDCTLKYGNLGCMGGDPRIVYQYGKLESLMREQDYPYSNDTYYKGITNPCKYKRSAAKYKAPNYSFALKNCTALALLLQKRTAAVSITAGGPEFQFYGSGVLQKCTDNVLNHAVHMIGINLEGGKELVPHWKFKNSWGIKWGEGGFGRVSMVNQGGNACGVCEGMITYLFSKQIKSKVNLPILLKQVQNNQGNSPKNQQNGQTFCTLVNHGSPNNQYQAFLYSFQPVVKINVVIVYSVQ